MIAPAKAKNLCLQTSGVEEFCRKRGIRKLSLFGSVVRDDYLPETSDVDVLAEFFLGLCGALGGTILVMGMSFRRFWARR